MSKIKDFLFGAFVRLVFAWVIIAISFEIFMMITMVVNPELETKIGNEIMWKIDGSFKNDPNNIWYEEPKLK
jgi:hypothetical protein